MVRAYTALAVTCALGATAAEAQAPAVRIVEPTAGIVEGPIVTLEAEVSDPEVLLATLVVNGASYSVPVEQGRITQRLVAVPGNNRVGVVIESQGQVARQSVTFRYEGEALEMVVLLGWPSRGEIVDLWVREPGGETCKWDHRQTATEGRLLDFSANAIGFGSQAYVLPRVSAGRYRVKVHYWGTTSDEDGRGWHGYEGLLSRLDELDEQLSATTIDANARQELQQERDRVQGRLDAWARPAAPQTPVRAEIVLFPGTHSERRYRFDVTVQRTGNLATVGEVEISDAMIRAARTEER